MAKLTERLQKGAPVSAGFTRGDSLGLKKALLTLALVSVTTDSEEKYLFFLFQVLNSKGIVFDGANINNYVPGELVTLIVNLEANAKYMESSLNRLTKAVADICGFETGYEWDPAYATAAHYKPFLGSVYACNCINVNTKAESLKYHVNVKAYKKEDGSLRNITDTDILNVFATRGITVTGAEIASAQNTANARKAHTTVAESDKHDATEPAEEDLFG